MVRLGSFVLDKPIGHGGMAAVWAGTHPATGTPVAIKLLDHRFSVQPDLAQALQEELLAVAAMDHAHIVWILDSGTVSEDEAEAAPELLTAGMPWFAMEQASGGDLNANRPTDWEQASSLFEPLLKALGHAHARGVVHRDLKPANVLLCTDKDARPGLKLTDFGIAVRLRGISGKVSSRATLHYAAPEILTGSWRDLGPPADLYALGCTAWALLCGAPPYQGLKGTKLAVAHITGRGRHPFTPRFWVPGDARKWVTTLLRRDLDARFQTAADALRALSAIEDGSGWTPPSQLPAQRHRSAPTAHSDAWDAVTPGVPERRDAAPPRPERPRIPPSWGHQPPAHPAPLHGAGQGLFAARLLPFVGRAAMRDALWERLRAAQRGPSQIVLIEGPSGCGTSRLAQWLGERAHELAGAHTMTARGEADLFGALAGLLGVADQGRHVCTARLTERFASLLGPDPEDEAASLALLLAKGGDPTKLRAAERHALVARVLRRLAEGAPSVVVLDHVASLPAALAFVAWEARQARAAGVVFVMVEASDRVASTPGVRQALDGLMSDPERTLHLCLGPLDTDDTEALLDSVLDLDPMMRAYVLRRVAGSPAFAAQLLVDWTQRGLLIAGPGGFVLPRGRTPDLPKRITALWRSRVHTLLTGRPDSDRTCLQLAAVLGHEVDRGEWLAASTHLGLQHSADLTDRLLADRLAEGSHASWRFASAALRETLLADARDSDHRGLTDAAVTAIGSGTPLTTLRIARLYLAGNRLDDAWPHLLSAMGASEWQGLVRRGLLAETMRVRDRGSTPTQRLTVELWRARGAHVAGDLATTERILTPLLDNPDLDDHTAYRVRYRWGKLKQRRMDYASAARIFDGLEGHKGQSKAQNAMRLHAWAIVSFAVGQLDRARTLLQNSASLTENPGLRADSLVTLGLICWGANERETARAHLEAALMLYTQDRDSFGQGMCNLNLGIFALGEKRLDDARAHFENAQRGYRRAESIDELLTCTSLANVALRTGQIDQAEAGYRAVLADRRTTPKARVTFHAQLGLAGCLAAQGHGDAAELELPWLEAKLASGAYDQPDVADELISMADAAEAADGQPAEARIFLVWARDLARRIDQTELAAQLQRRLDGAAPPP
jgi:serine/threonine protein kinase/tetratricopeptide (TPR) repeat protein